MTLTHLIEQLGPAATAEDAEKALELAEDWYNRTPKADVLAWYETYRRDNEHAPDINDPSDPSRLLAGWNGVLIYERAASLADWPATE